MLTPPDEGAFQFWYKGKVYLAEAGLGALPGADAKDLKVTWWKLVRNKAGRMGWTSSDKFLNADACG
jgi:hypothetical protein